MKEKVLVTGANGFIGANLVRRLLEEDKYKIYLFLRKDSDLWRISDVLGNLNISYVDLKDAGDTEKAVKSIGPDYIFHLAAAGSHPKLEKDDFKIIQANIIGTSNLLIAAQNIDYKCFVNVGSSSEYGIKNGFMSEDDVLEPINIYGASKASASIICQAFSKVYGRNIITLRPFSVYGPYESGFRLIPYVIMSSLRKEKMILTSGEQKRDFLFVGDLIDVYMKIIDKKGLAGEIINIGSGKDSKVKDVVTDICSLTDYKKQIIFGQKKMRKFEAMQSWKADTSKMRKILDYVPETSLNDGLKKTVEWFRKNMNLYNVEIDNQ